MYDAILRNHINELQQTKPSAIITYANIPRVNRFCQFFICLISFILDRKRSIALSVRQSSSPSPPTWYFKTHYTDNLCEYNMQFRDGRAAIVGAQRVQERSSRSRFESRYRSYSQSGLGAE